jgi:small-conductance mechanosensitive channel/CRP-like cAMP-binding protein
MFDSFSPIAWGTALLVLFPLLIIVIGEAIHRQGAGEEAQVYALPLALLRNSVLPLAFIDILLRKVIGWESSHLAVKLADTALWIVVLNALIAVLNILLFREKSTLAGRQRIPKLLLDLFRLFVVGCGAAFVISWVWDVDLSSLVTALGVGSVVIGLALQDTLGSLFAGIALVSARQFRVGDWIKFKDGEGLVVAMDWRSVKVRTRAGDALYLPNGAIARESVTVLAGAAGYTARAVEMRFPYETSPDRVIGLLTEAARQTNGFHMDPPVRPSINEFQEKCISYRVQVRTTDPLKVSGVSSEYLSNVWYLAQRNGLAFFVDSSETTLVSGDQQGAHAEASPQNLASKLAAVGTFRIDNEALLRLVHRSRLERYRAGQTVIERGETVDHVYALTAGRAQASIDPEDGDAIALHEYEPGQLLMAKSLLRGTSTPFTLKALTEIETVAIPADDFKAMCANDLSLARDIEHMLSAREESTQRTLAKALQADEATLHANDRLKLMTEIFRA